MAPLLLSSRLASRHKYIQTYLYPIAVLAAGAAFLLWMSDKKDAFFIVYIGLAVLYLAYMLHSRGKRLYQLAYDQEYLYLKNKEQEEIIPLWQIQQVVLTTLNGGYRIDFMKGFASHEFILFLPSFWYPLNYKGQDAKVESFQEAILRAKSSFKADYQQQSLPSST